MKGKSQNNNFKTDKMKTNSKENQNRRESPALPLLEVLTKHLGNVQEAFALGDYLAEVSAFQRELRMEPAFSVHFLSSRDSIMKVLEEHAGHLCPAFESIAQVAFGMIVLTGKHVETINLIEKMSEELENL